METVEAREIAARFLAGWQDAWNGADPEAVARLYSPDSMLVGVATGIGRDEVGRLLGAIHGQGWTRIAIGLIEARSVGGVVLAVGEFTATGSGPTKGKTLDRAFAYSVPERLGKRPSFVRCRRRHRRRLLGFAALSTAPRGRRIAAPISPRRRGRRSSPPITAGSCSSVIFSSPAERRHRSRRRALYHVLIYRSLKSKKARS